MISRLPAFAAVLMFFSAVACQPQPETSAEGENVEGASSQTTEVLYTSQFINKGGQETVGTYRIERTGEDLRIVLADDFRTDDGPDLHVALTPVLPDSADNNNVIIDGSVIVAPLERFTGEQTYDLPDTLDLSTQKSVLIHCIEFSHLYGAAPIQ